MVRAFRHRAVEMHLPRALIVSHLMGRTMGAPFDVERHHRVLSAAFDLFESATAGGTIVDLPDPYRPAPHS